MAREYALGLNRVGSDRRRQREVTPEERNRLLALIAEQGQGIMDENALNVAADADRRRQQQQQQQFKGGVDPAANILGGEAYRRDLNASPIQDAQRVGTNVLTQPARDLSELPAVATMLGDVLSGSSHQRQDAGRQAGAATREFFDKHTLGEMGTKALEAIKSNAYENPLDVLGLKAGAVGAVAGLSNYAKRGKRFKELAEEQGQPDDVLSAAEERATAQGYTHAGYHGTKGKIDPGFDPEFLGATTRAGSARLGFFFSKDPKTAETYSAHADLKKLDPERYAANVKSKEKTLKAARVAERSQEDLDDAMGKELFEIDPEYRAISIEADQFVDRLEEIHRQKDKNQGRGAYGDLDLELLKDYGIDVFEGAGQRTFGQGKRRRDVDAMIQEPSEVHEFDAEAYAYAKEIIEALDDDTIHRVISKNSDLNDETIGGAWQMPHYTRDPKLHITHDLSRHPYELIESSDKLMQKYGGLLIESSDKLIRQNKSMAEGALIAMDHLLNEVRTPKLDKEKFKAYFFGEVEDVEAAVDFPPVAFPTSRIKRGEVGHRYNMTHDRYVNRPAFDRNKTLKKFDEERELSNAWYKSAQLEKLLEPKDYRHHPSIEKMLDEKKRFKKSQSEHNRSASDHSFEGKQMLPVKLKIKNPLIKDYEGKSYREESYRSVLERAIKSGHDGVIMKNTKDGGGITDIYVVFEPHQIRSRFALFEPGAEQSSDLLSSYTPVLLPLGAGASAAALAANRREEDPLTKRLTD